MIITFNRREQKEANAGPAGDGRRTFSLSFSSPAGALRAGGLRESSLCVCSVSGVSACVQFQPFDRHSLGIAVRLQSNLRAHTVREAAAGMGISSTVVVRLVYGEVTAIGSVIAGCRYVGLHPFAYLGVPADVSRQTVTGTSAVVS